MGYRCSSFRSNCTYTFEVKQCGAVTTISTTCNQTKKVRAREAVDEALKPHLPPDPVIPGPIEMGPLHIRSPWHEEKSD